MQRLLFWCLTVGVVALCMAAQPIAAEAAPKSPVPKKAALALARKEVDEVYRDSVAKAKTPAQHSEIAQQMLRDGLDSTDKPDVQFALLRGALDLFVLAGEPDKAFLVIDELSDRFQLKRDSLRADTILKAAKTSKSTARQTLLTQALQLAEALDARQDFASARRLYEFAVDEAKARKDLTLIKQAVKMRDQSARQAKTFQGVQDAKAALEKNPDDPQANQTVGSFHCFVERDWKAGLPLLARSSDEVLKSLATRDLEGARLDADRQLKLGDDWWAAAEKRSDDATAMQSRAGYWYRRALPAVKGLAKLRVEKRLATLPAADPLAEQNAPDQVETMRTFRFTEPSSLSEFVIKGAGKIEDPVEALPRDSRLWQIVDDELRIRSLGESKSTQVILTEPYDSISEVTISGRIVPPNRNNFRFQIGRHRFIFNWEQEDKNLVLIDSNIVHRFEPPAVTPGTLHTFSVKQDGVAIRVSVDGKQVFEFEGALEGEFKFRAEEGTTIGIRSLTIEGKASEKPTTQP